MHISDLIEVQLICKTKNFNSNRTIKAPYIQYQQRIAKLYSWYFFALIVENQNPVIYTFLIYALLVCKTNTFLLENCSRVIRTKAEPIWCCAPAIFTISKTEFFLRKTRLKIVGHSELSWHVFIRLFMLRESLT